MINNTPSRKTPTLVFRPRLPRVVPSRPLPYGRGSGAGDSLSLARVPLTYRNASRCCFAACCDQLDSREGDLHVLHSGEPRPSLRTQRPWSRRVRGGPRAPPARRPCRPGAPRPPPPARTRPGTAHRLAGEAKKGEKETESAERDALDRHRSEASLAKRCMPFTTRGISGLLRTVDEVAE